MSTQSRVPRNALGHPLKGHSLNPHGRERGSKTATTKLAARRLAAHADRAARVLLEALTDEHPWVRINAAKTILERTDLLNPDDNKMDLAYATEKEERTLAKLVGRIQRRMARGQVVRDLLADAPAPQHPASEFTGIPAPVIDITAEAEDDVLIIPLGPVEEA